MALGHLRRFARRGTAGLGALVVCASLVTVGTPRPAGAAAGTLRWSACETDFRCATMQVPASYRDPAAGSLAISIIELPAQSRSVKGDIVFNPGGPGASGISFLTQAATSFPRSLRASFNLVSFDPRGVGASDPVRCTNAAGIRSLIALDPAPVSGPQIAGVVRGVRSYVKSCERNTPKLVLDHLGTLDTVRDLNRLRIALGQRQLNYFGFSYGTYIGELYAKLFPHTIRTMVLDGVVDPALSTTASNTEQAVGFEQDLNDFYRWCPTNKACASALPRGAESSLDTLLTRLAAGGSIRARLAPLYGGTVRVTDGVLMTAVAASLYSDQQWPGLARAIAGGLRGNGELLAAIAYSYAGLQPDGTYTNMLAANTATGCEDNSAPATVGDYPALAAAMARVAPVFGASEAWGTLACTLWPVHPTSHPAPVVNRSKHPILVIGSTGDPATPYVGAQRVASELKNAELLTRQGPGHTGYLFSSCIRSWTDRYLETGALPPPNTVCPTD